MKPPDSGNNTGDKNNLGKSQVPEGKSQDSVGDSSQRSNLGSSPDNPVGPSQDTNRESAKNSSRDSIKSSEKTATGAVQNSTTEKTPTKNAPDKKIPTDKAHKENIPSEKSWRTLYHDKTMMWLIILIIAVIAVIYIRHLISSKQPHRPPAQPVVVATVTTADVPVYLSALGAVTPTYSVTVKTQINGTLLQVLFHEGQDVKQGDLLAQIDPRPYQALVVQYQGQLERDRELLANAKIDLVRYQNLYKTNSVSQQILSTQESLVKQLIGTVQLDEGQLEGAQVDLVYCSIKSPIDGRVGLRLVDPGNYVQTSDTTGIAVINTINPITVIFTIPEDNVPQVLQRISAKIPIDVKAYNREQTQLLATGTLITIDNQIDPTTGTVKLRAQFPNGNDILFPDQFVNVQMLVDTLHNAIVVPTAAVQVGSQGPYVFLLNTDSTVSVKPITVGITSGDNTVVTAGLTPREIIVVQGEDKLSDGSTVTVFNPAQPAQTNNNNNKQHKNHRSSNT